MLLASLPSRILTSLCFLPGLFIALSIIVGPKRAHTREVCGLIRRSQREIREVSDQISRRFLPIGEGGIGRDAKSHTVSTYPRNNHETRHPFHQLSEALIHIEAKQIAMVLLHG